MSKTTNLVIACTLLLAACSSSPPVRYFTLQSGSAAPAGAMSAAMMATAAARSVQLTSLSLPEAVDRMQLVLRTGDNTLSVNEHARWAEPLKAAFAQALASGMRAALDGAPVVVRAGGLEDMAWKLSVDVQRFDAQAGKSVVLEAVWTLRGRDAGKALTRASVIQEAANGDTLEAIVAAQSRAVAALAREIGDSVEAQVRSAAH
jgi:uncharacterized lipoprotein YmbA